jgi:oxygen-independent coproporphyrinogen-3 oxidase
MEGEIMERTARAIGAEIRNSPLKGRPAKTIFFGGGTPTFLSEAQLLHVFEAVLETHPPLEGAEITSEANPGTVDAEKFSAMRQAGFNRISMGAQSFLDSDLLALGRIHRSGEIERAYEAARKAGFNNVNLDLMFALPQQSMHGWRRNLDRALALDPEHLSLYCLTIEPNTAFYKMHLRGQLVLPDDEQQVAMYEECLDRTAAAGFEQYEISNFAKPGRECRHNLCYWLGEEYVGYGPGAVGAVEAQSKATPRSLASTLHTAGAEGSKRVRYTNLKHPDRYCAAVEGSEDLQFEKEELTPELLRMESTMLRLRLSQGMPRQHVDDKPLSKVIERGWVNADEARIWLTREGRHFCSEVALELI